MHRNVLFEKLARIMIGAKVVESGASWATPERDLLVAVLQRAILDYVGSGEVLRSEAGEWLFDDAEHAFSFPWVCGHLGLEPEAVRVNLGRLSEGAKKDAAPLRVLRRCA